MTICTLFITAGQVVAYVMGWLLSTTPHGWRWMVGLGAIPALAQSVTLVFMPETPRWLVKAGRESQARAVLRKTYGSGSGAEEVVQTVLTRVEREVREEEVARSERGRGREMQKGGVLGMYAEIVDGLGELFDRGGNRRALVIACMLQGFQQLCGFVSRNRWHFSHRSCLPFWKGGSSSNFCFLHFDAAQHAYES